MHAIRLEPQCLVSKYIYKYKNVNLKLIHIGTERVSSAQPIRYMHIVIDMLLFCALKV